MTKKKLVNEPPKPTVLSMELGRPEQFEGRSYTCELDFLCTFGDTPKSSDVIPKELLKDWMRRPIRKDFLGYRDAELRDRTVETIQARKFLFLFSYFNIPFGDWEKLARAVALEFVPGLKVEDGAPSKKVGKPPKWGPAKDRELLGEVHKIIADGLEKSKQKACLRVLKADPARWGYAPTIRGEALTRAAGSIRTRFFEAEKKLKTRTINIG